MKAPLLALFLAFISLSPGFSQDQSQLQLESAYDINEIRIDLIRQSSCDDEGNEEFRAYHNLGFDLGHGLFYDLNNNLGFNVLTLFQLQERDTFQIIHTQNGLMKTKTRYHRTDSLLTTVHPIFNFKDRKRFHFPDSNTVIIKNFLSKIMIYRNGPKLIKEQSFNDCIIQETDDGYETKEFFSRRNFRLVDDEIILHKSFKIKKENDEILIFRSGLFPSRRPIHRISINENSVHVQSRWNRNLHIFKEGNKIFVENGRRSNEIYELL